MKKTLFILIPVIILFCACALEVGNIVGPAGGYIFLDRGKGSYDTLGYRYLECSPINAGIIENFETKNSFQIQEDINKAMTKLNSESKFNNWELPDNETLRMMLQSFRWELTRFGEKRYQYISSELDVYRGTTENTILSEQDKIAYPVGNVYIRPIRKF